MKPTIILPTKNRRAHVVRAIEDILRQTWKSFHLLVVDHNSNDGTGEVISRIKDRRIRYIHHEGYHDAAFSPKNAALKNLPDDSTGILFHDDDDTYCSPFSLECLIDAARSLGNQFGICMGDYVEGSVDDSNVERVSGRILTTEEIAERCWFPVKAAYFAKDLVQKIGLLPPIRSRETIVWAYFLVQLIESGVSGKTLYYTGQPIINKIRHSDAISIENKLNGCREASEILLQNIHRITQSSGGAKNTHWFTAGLLDVG